MHRQPLLQLLDAYLDAWPEEHQVVERIRSLVEAKVDCFERTCRPGHLTGSAWIMTPDGQKSLLLHHKKLDKWLQPGGHADGETDIAAVARREAVEESGLRNLRLSHTIPLDVDVHRIPERYSLEGELIEDAHDHHDLRFLFIAEDGQNLVLSDESNELRWCSPDEVHALTDEWSVLRLMEKASQQIGT